MRAHPTMAREVVFGARRFWILSEPGAKGWRATVVEIVDPEGAQKNLGLDAIGDTRSSADDAAHGKLQRWLKGQRDAPT